MCRLVACDEFIATLKFFVSMDLMLLCYIIMRAFDSAGSNRLFP